ncbi:MAG: glycosyltransferase, partial [Pseudomonadota bacterium]|nr:glycosyltransferase [Pseudomonadota bacterium]
MRNGCVIACVIPALNEEAAIGKVIAEIPGWVDQVLVVDNGSTDATAKVAREAGAEVTSEPERGYGAACLAGLARIGNA